MVVDKVDDRTVATMVDFQPDLIKASLSRSLWLKHHHLRVNV